MHVRVLLCYVPGDPAMDRSPIKKSYQRSKRINYLRSEIWTGTGQGHNRWQLKKKALRLEQLSGRTNLILSVITYTFSNIMFIFIDRVNNVKPLFQYVSRLGWAGLHQTSLIHYPTIVIEPQISISLTSSWIFSNFYSLQIMCNVILFLGYLLTICQLQTLLNEEWKIERGAGGRDIYYGVLSWSSPGGNWKNIDNVTVVIWKKCHPGISWIKKTLYYWAKRATMKYPVAIFPHYQ
jgi:hypothetical protein